MTEKDTKKRAVEIRRNWDPGSPKAAWHIIKGGEFWDDYERLEDAMAAYPDAEVVIDRPIGAAWKGDGGAAGAGPGRGDSASIERGRPHCWTIEFCDEDGDEEGYPRAGCRHCPETADLCPECDGEGVSQDGEEADCPACEGWGVMLPDETKGATR